MPLFLAPEEAAADHIDLLRHTLGNLVVPRTVDDIDQYFARAAADGAVLPSGRTHQEVAGPARDILIELENAGYAKRYQGFSNHHELNTATDRDGQVITHPPPHDKAHAPGAFFQVQTRGEIWADEAASDIGAEHWIMTNTGFRALTGEDA